MNTGNEAVVSFPRAAGDLADSVLMDQVRQGDVGVLGELFERHHQGLFSFFARLVRNRSAAEDLVQEVFVRMLRYRSTFRADSEFVPWMFTLARNAATDRYRARPKELQEDPDAPEPAAGAPHPIDALERREQTTKLKRALGRLTTDRRETLLLARFSGLNYDRLGELLGISEGALKGRVHRELGDLKKAYHAEGLRRGLHRLSVRHGEAPADQRAFDFRRAPSARDRAHDGGDDRRRRRWPSRR